ncbi:MAG: peptidylprolyl isomerase [Myxococcota bacterium]|nr:peptidylprolyl isomerase [Myxococcota bacterium]
MRASSEWQLFVLAALAAFLLMGACDSRPTRKKAVLGDEVTVAKAPPLDEKGEPKAVLEGSPEGKALDPLVLPQDLWLGAPPSQSFIEAEHAQEPVLTMDDRVITLEEIDVQLRTLPFTAVAGLHSEHAQQALLEQTRDFELLAKEARRRGYEQTPACRFARLLGLVRALRMKVYDEATQEVTEAQIAVRYEANRFRYQSPEKRRGNLILVATQEEAQAARAQLLEKAPSDSPQRVRSFEQLATELSLHKGSKRTGGRIRALAVNEADADPIMQAYLPKLFELPLYGLSQPFSVGEQWGLALLVMINPERKMSLQDAAPSLRTLIASEQAAQRFARMIDEAAQKHQPSVDLSALESLELVEETLPKGYQKARIAVAPDKEEQLVALAGGTRIDMGMLAVALSAWPEPTQRKLLRAIPGTHPPGLLRSESSPPDYDFLSMGRSTTSPKLMTQRSDEGLGELLKRLAGIAEEARLQGMERSLLLGLEEKAALVELLKTAIDQEIGVLEASDGDVEAYYYAHRDEFRRAEMRRGVRVVLATREEAEQLRQEILTQSNELERSSALSQEASRRSLIEHDRENGGRLPYVSLEGTDEHVDAVSETAKQILFALEPNALSEVFEDEGGWVILLLDAVRAASDVPLSAARASIRAKLERKPRQVWMQAFLGSLAEGIALTQHPEALEHLHLPEIHHGH